MAKTNEKVLLGVLIGMFVISGFAMLGALNGFYEDDARALALNTVNGKVLEVEADNKNGQLVYEVDVVNEDGAKEVTIDSQGNVVGVEDEEVDVPITGNALDKASQVALDYIGEGRVTDSEIGDEEGYYEIEITLDDGGEVDVHLDENFNVLSTEYD